MLCGTLPYETSTLPQGVAPLPSSPPTLIVAKRAFTVRTSSALGGLGVWGVRYSMIDRMLWMMGEKPSPFGSHQNRTSGELQSSANLFRKLGGRMYLSTSLVSLSNSWMAFSQRIGVSILPFTLYHCHLPPTPHCMSLISRKEESCNAKASLCSKNRSRRAFGPILDCFEQSTQL